MGLPQSFRCSFSLYHLCVTIGNLNFFLIYFEDTQKLNLRSLYFSAKTEISEYPRGYSVNFGTQLLLKCVALGDPLPEIVWYQNGEQVRMIILKDLLI